MAHIRRHPKSGRWQVRYRDPSGRERTKTFERKVDANRYAASVAADVHRGEYLDPKDGKVTVGERAELWRKGRKDLAQATQAQDRSLLESMILPTFRHRTIRSVVPSEVRVWLSGLEAAPATKAKAMQKLSAIFRDAMHDGLIRSNPCDGVKRPPVARVRAPRVLSDDEVGKLLAAAEGVDETTAAMVWLMAGAGLRIGEAIALRRSDVDGSTLHVRGSMSRSEGRRPVKGKSEGRTIPLRADVAARLHQHLASRSVVALDGALFTAPTGGQLRYDNWRSRQWRKIVDRAGIGEVRPHDLRHTVATRLFAVDGWTPPQVQAYMGHDDPAVTLRVYTHIRAQSLPQPSSAAAL